MDDFFIFMLCLFSIFYIIAWIIVIIKNFFNRNNKQEKKPYDGPEWEQGWPF